MLVPVKDANGEPLFINTDNIILIEKGKEEGLSEVTLVGGKKIVLTGEPHQASTLFNKRSR